MEALPRTIAQFCIDNSKRIGAMPDAILKELIHASKKGAGEEAALRSDPVESPEIRPIENTRCLSTACEE